ncbi:vitamin B12 ABC transporter substrate-binding protein BtuF [Vibrio sp. WJH972]
MHKLIFILTLFATQTAVANQYQRIITLAPHATELAFSAGLGDKIIAVSAHSDYPEEAHNLEKVASYQGIKLERILALNPDLVISWPAGNPMRELEKLEKLGVEVYKSQVTTIDSIADSIDKLSQYADDPSIGQRNAQKFRDQLLLLKQEYQHKPNVNYFYQLSEKPIITVAQDNWPSEVFRFCGGVNIFETSSAPYPQVGIEQVVLGKPDAIFTSRHAMENGDMWFDWSTIPAVKNQHIWMLNADWINRPTPRTLNAITQVCEYLDVVRESH